MGLPNNPRGLLPAAVLKKAYMISSNSFQEMMNVLNIGQKDYRKFMSLKFNVQI
jgi:hypothetical protein